MNLDQIYQELQNIVNSGDPTFANFAQYIGQATHQCHSGQMSASELTETLQDIQRQLAIVEDMSQLQFKEKLNTLINGLITIAGAVA